MKWVKVQYNNYSHRKVSIQVCVYICILVFVGPYRSIVLRIATRDFIPSSQNIIHRLLSFASLFFSSSFVAIALRKEDY